MKTTEERLLQQLEETEIKLSELESKNNLLQTKLDNLQYEEEWRWRHIRKLSDEENLDLPVPRLEMRYNQISPYEWLYEYSLVYRHFLGHIVVSPLGSTKTSGSGYPHTELSLPFRDGAHMKHEMKQLNLRGFIVNGTFSREVDLQKD